MALGWSTEKVRSMQNSSTNYMKVISPITTHSEKGEAVGWDKNSNIRTGPYLASFKYIAEQLKSEV